MKHSESLSVTAEGERDILITRSFEAPAELLFRALGDPDWIQRWMAGPPGWTMSACRSDLRVGGRLRYEWSGPAGEQMAMFGEFLEVHAPTRIVHTESFEIGCEVQAGQQHIETDLVEEDGCTQLKLRIRYPSGEARNGALTSGMEQGLAANYLRLDDGFREGLAR